MMRGRIFALLLVFLSFFACTCTEQTPPTIENSEENSNPFEVYWADDYAGKMGIQVKTLKPGEPRMYLADKLLYVTGTNCFNLFTQTFVSLIFPLNNVKKTFAVFEEEKVPVVRFSAIPYYAKDYGLYFENKKEYLAALDSIATLADKKHIGLVPSIFWKPLETAKYYEEEYKAWGDKNSQTYKFMLDYTRDIVNTLKNHKSILAWEFGNEFSLDADISIAGYPELSANDVRIAYKGFADLVAELDPHNRMIGSGNSIMRNAQYHLLHNKNWDIDSFNQYVEITEVMTPDPMKGMSEHVYEEPRIFSDKGTVSKEEQIRYAKEAAARNGKVYYIGEFTGPRAADEVLMRKNYQIYVDNKVQLSMVWNFALKGDVEWSFSAASDMGKMTFSLMREYNEKMIQISE